METAARYRADYVFFRAPSATQPVVAEALVYVDDGLSDEAFAQLHRRLWSWGGVPLVYRKKRGRVDLLRCAHRPDFASSDGQARYLVFSTLDLLTEIDRKVEVVDPWWDISMLREGSLWEDPAVCEKLLSADKEAQRWLLQAIADRERELNEERVLPSRQRRLLVLSLLIAYLEDRGVLGAKVFARCKPGARSFFEVLADGPGLVTLLTELEGWFNGDVFTLSDVDRTTILASRDLGRFAALVERESDERSETS